MANLRITELDFDTIKTNLKTFLNAQTEFTDYDFEGSGLSVLIDLLAYNTHYNAYLANMLVNEMFLDSAVKRSSAVSIAKHLGYTPRSIVGSTAVLDVTVNNPVNNPTSLTLPIYSPFTTTINNEQYTFLTTQAYTITPSSGVYLFENITVKQGTLLQYSYTVTTPGPDEKYEIPNLDVDTTTMLVTVQNSSSDTTTTTYTNSQTIVDVDADSTVYFLEENTLGKYQIYFGDDIIGKKLAAGNIVTIKYLVSVGAVTNVSGNISQSFQSGGAIGGSSSISVTTVSNSTNGAAKESITSIKFNAPRAYLAMDRAVTKNDYSSIIKASYPQVEAVSVWGGEDNDPPVYGKVFISLKPYEGYVINEATKQSIKNTLLKGRQILTVFPEFIDPDYIYVGMTVDVFYNKNRTTTSAAQISSLVNSAVLNYFTSTLQEFETPFYYSQLINKVLSVNNSIVSAVAQIELQKRIQPVLNVSNSYLSDSKLKFSNRIQPGTFISTLFYISYLGESTGVVIRDLPDSMPPDLNGTGTLRLYNFLTDTDLGAVGTINYRLGDVVINNITPVGYPAGQFDIRLNVDLQKDSYNITTARNQIVTYDNSTKSIPANRTAGLTINVTAIS